MNRLITNVFLLLIWTAIVINAYAFWRTERQLRRDARRWREYSQRCLEAQQVPRDTKRLVDWRGNGVKPHAILTNITGYADSEDGESE